MQCVFVHFLEEMEDSEKAFRNYLTFKKKSSQILSKNMYSKKTLTKKAFFFHPREPQHMDSKAPLSPLGGSQLLNLSRSQNST